MVSRQDESPPAPGGKDGALIAYARRQAELAGSPQGEPFAFCDAVWAKVNRLRTELPAKSYFPGYDVIRLLASGAEGVVYEAIQKRTKGKVAIKALVSGLPASSRARKRFEREIELIVQLRHPNIVTLFEAGTTVDGLPFYVMDYIKGATLDRFVRQKDLSVVETLRLFSKVCRAVQHFHQKGIIHRDLKPSNILVDTLGAPKIVDFGLAKLLAGPVDLTLSVSREIKGTVPYMSPEQSEGRVDAVDTRSDVYSLGVILYELLTGTFPYPVIGSQREVLDHISQTPPTSPRHAWRTASGSNGGSTPGHPTGRCPFGKDVELIVLSALEKDPDHRYPSAQALADDLDRHLRNEPIPRHVSRAYRFRKFVARHRAATLAVATVTLAVLLGGATSTVYAFREGRARRVAESEARKAQSALGFLRAMLMSVQPEAMGGREVPLVDVLDEATNQLEHSQVSEPVVEAMVRLAIGSTYLKFFERLKDAELHLQRAKLLFERVHGYEHPDVADALFYLGWLETRKGHNGKAKELYRQCVAMRESLFGQDDQRVASALWKLAALYRHTGEFSAAESTLERALRICRQVGRSADITTAEILSEFALLHNQTADFQGAASYAREALVAYRNAHGPHHTTVATAMTRLGTAVRELGQFEEAEHLFRAAYGIRKDLYGARSAVAAETLVELSYVLRDRGAYLGSEQALTEALSILREVYGQRNLCTINTELALAKLFVASDKPKDAVGLFPKIIDGYATMFNSEENFYVANARSVYGECLLALDRYKSAEHQLRIAYEFFSAGDAAPGKARIAASRLASLYEELGNLSEAERWRSIGLNRR